MNLTPFALLLFISCAAECQKTETFYTFDWKKTDAAHARFFSVAEHTDSGWHRVDYFVQGPTVEMDGWYEDTTWKVGNGRFVYAFPDKKIETAGRYVHGRKEGLWLKYYYNGMLADSTVWSDGQPIGTSVAYYPDGMQKDSNIYHPDGSGIEISWFGNGTPSSAGMLAPGGKKIGKWQYWHDNGKFAAIELYDHDTLLQSQYFDENGQPMVSASKDQPASFGADEKAWMKYLDKHLNWPPNYQITNGDEAAVVVGGTVDEAGNVIDVYIVTPFYPPFEKEALRVIGHSPKWQPAIRHNRRVRYHFRQPVVFQQQEY